MSKGVIYVCSGSESHLKECYHSVRSLKKHNPDLPVTLFTDMKNIKGSLFDEIIVVDYECHPLKQKILCMLRSPHKKTLYIDTDTEICGPLDYIFNELSYSDLMVCHEGKIDYDTKPPKLINYVNKKEFNTGVIAFNRSNFLLIFLERWKNLTLSIDDKLIYPGHGIYEDQFCFNKVIEDRISPLNIRALDNKIYNTVRWMYEYMNKEEREAIIIKHWHDLHLNTFQWKAKSLFTYIKNKINDIFQS